MATNAETFVKLREVLLDETVPLAKRYRALFTLKNLGGKDAVDAMGAVLDAALPSALLKHEVAYCLGQLQDSSAIPVLERTLANAKEDNMVRHEAGEALGAIGGDEVEGILMRFVDDPAVEVAETCQLAVDLLKWRNTKEEVEDNNPYHSIDPAPPSKARDINELKDTLCNAELSMFVRYKAMFALRNLNTPESVEALCAAFDDKSALFRHELAYVLGQMAHPASVPALKKVLITQEEHPMVRHEAAEALGSIASEECDELLRQFKEDAVPAVAESCVVAIDMSEYANSDAFQYADGLSQIEAK